MTLDELLEEWSPDCRIEPLDLFDSLRRIPLMINKYRRYLAIENKELRKLETRHKQLVHLKTEYLMGILNGTEELKELGWEPCKRIILKADVPRHLDADKELIKLTEMLADQREKTDVLHDILKELAWRSNTIKGMIEWKKITEGIA